MNRPVRNRTRRHSRNISNPYNVDRHVDLSEVAKLNSADIGASSTNHSHLPSSSQAGNSSSSGYDRNIARSPTKDMSEADFYKYMANALSGRDCAGSSSNSSKPTRYYNHGYTTSHDPFVEESSSKVIKVEDNNCWENDILEEHTSAGENGHLQYPNFKPLTPKEKKAKSKALARKAKSSQGVVNQIGSSDKGKSIVRHYEEPAPLQSSNNKKVSTTNQDALATSDIDGQETQSAHHSGRHHSARSSYSVKRDLVVWDVHWDQLMLMNLVAKIRQHGLDPVLQEAVSEMSQTLSVDGYMQHFTKLYCLRKKCGMKLPKLPPGHSEPTMTETTASMNLLLPQEGLHLRLKALEKQFKEEKEERESGLKRDIAEDGDFAPSQNVRNSIINSFSRAETAAMASKRCLAHFKQEEKSDETVVPSSSRRGPGRPRKPSTGQVWWALENDDAPAEVDSSSGTCVASAVPDRQDASTVLDEPAAPVAPTAFSVFEEPMPKFVATIPPTPVISGYPNVPSTRAVKNEVIEAATPKRIAKKKSFPAMEWFSDRKKRNTPAGRTVAARMLEDTPVKKSRTGIPSAVAPWLTQSEDRPQLPTPSNTSSAFSIFRKLGQGGKANKKTAKHIPIASLYPHTQTMQPPAYQKPLTSGPALVKPSQSDLVHNGTERRISHDSKTLRRLNNLDHDIADEGLMIRNSMSDSQYESDNFSELQNSYLKSLEKEAVLSTNQDPIEANEQLSEDQLSDRFERELSLEDSPRAIFKAEKRHVESTDILGFGDPNFLRGMNEGYHERPSNYPGGLSKASRKRLNKLPSIETVIDPGQGQAQFGSEPPPIPVRSDARQLRVAPLSPRKPQKATVPSASPAKAFTAYNGEASPLLTRQLKESLYYPFVPTESTPIAPSEEWQQGTPRP